MTRPAAAILLTGSELLRGVIADRNAAHLAADLEDRGFAVRRTLVVGDEISDIRQGLEELLALADLVVTSGGLGPTHDDRTVEALAQVAGVDLPVDEQVLARITSWTDTVAQRLQFDPSRFADGNRKQARIPLGASVLGLAGTAPGLVMPVREVMVVVLPGVPSELRRLWALAPEHEMLRPLFARAVPRTRLLLRTYGIGESHVADLFAEAGGDPPGVETSICARNFEIEIDIRALPEAAVAAHALRDRLLPALGEYVFATDERPLPELVLEAARRRGISLATAESCTGGMVAAALTDVPGSSDMFRGGVVAYSDRLKRCLLNVPAQVLATQGAVSPESAAAMAAGARSRLEADLAVAVTGIAGPAGGSDDKPVGLVHLHVSSPLGEAARRLDWPGDRAEVRARATAAALHLVRAHLVADS